MADSIADIWAASITAEREQVVAKTRRTLASLVALKNKTGPYADAHRRLLRLYQAYLRAIEEA